MRAMVGYCTVCAAHTGFFPRDDNKAPEIQIVLINAINNALKD